MINEHPARPAIVVGVDGSDSALHATRWAAREAALRKLPLRLVHVYDPPTIRHPATAAVRTAYINALGDHGRHWVREATAAASTVAAGLDISQSVRVGHPAEVMIEESAGARLLVLGSRGLGGFPDLLVGSVALATAEHGRCPVVVVGGQPTGDGPVLVGVDGSPASEAAVGFAFDAASMRGAGLIALHTWTDPSFTGIWTRVGLDVDWPAVAEEERRLLDERMAGWQEKYPDVAVRRLVVRDRPVRALLEQAERARAQLIVVGARGLPGAFTAMGMGSTSRTLLHHAECPVAVVRPDSRERTDR